MKYLILFLLFVGCSDLDEKDFLGCTEVNEKELCVYCDRNGVIEVEGELEYSCPYVLCEDWCSYVNISYQIEGCKEYRKGNDSHAD